MFQECLIILALSVTTQCQDVNFWQTPATSNNLNLLYNDDPPANGETFDFIIVGSGSGGAPLANRLSENPEWKILLLEAGDVANPLVDIPIMAPLLQKTKLDWGYVAEYQNESCRGCSNKRMNCPRGRGLGGSTLINFMTHVRGNPLDYDRWAAMGNPGWSYEDVLAYLKKLEDAKMQQQDSDRNIGGYVAVTDVPFRTKAVNAYVEAAQQAGYPYVDYNGKDQMGVSYVQGNIRHGFRCSVEKAYLRPIRDRKNLKVLVNSRVTKVLIDPISRSCYGVQFVRKGQYYKVNTTKEVLLAAGAFNSPQLLMLSGIGPKDHLEELGIPVIKDLSVGKRMYDHPVFLGLNFLVNRSIVLTDRIYYDLSNTYELFSRGRGPLTSLSMVEGLTYIKTSAAQYDESYPDVEIIVPGTTITADMGQRLRETFSISQELYDGYWKPIENRPVFQVIPMLTHPKSHGYLKLKSKNPFHWPKLYPQYFTDERNEDIKTFIAAIREIIRIVQMPAFEKYGTKLYEKPLPGCGSHKFNSDSYWECALRTTCPTMHDQTTTCKMGPESDPEAVVDLRLRVYGINKLRVVDTSIIPLTLSGHTSIPAVMVGEKAADMIKEDWYIEELANKIDIRSIKNE